MKPAIKASLLAFGLAKLGSVTTAIMIFSNPAIAPYILAATILALGTSVTLCIKGRV